MKVSVESIRLQYDRMLQETTKFNHSPEAWMGFLIGFRTAGRKTRSGAH